MRSTGASSVSGGRTACGITVPHLVGMGLGAALQVSGPPDRLRAAHLTSHCRWWRGIRRRVVPLVMASPIRQVCSSLRFAGPTSQPLPMLGTDNVFR